MNTKNLTKEQEDIILKEYIELGHGQNTTMKAAKVSLEELKTCLEKNGYHLRNRHEAIMAANKGRNLLKNQDYFSHQSENMAWLLGFLAADGSIEKNRNVIKLSLSSIDKEILEKIREEIQLESPVKDYITSGGYFVSKIQWSSEKHKKDLSQYGVIPQKTFLLKPPTKLERKYFKDYIRGFWDGDGSIVINRNNYNSLTWEIGSATKEILDFINDFFYEEYGIPKVNIHKIRRKEDFYLLMYSTTASLKIYDIFYQNPNALSLARKKEKYTNLVQEHNKMK